jgi:hypothetical protein
VGLAEPVGPTLHQGVKSGAVDEDAASVIDETVRELRPEDDDGLYPCAVAGLPLDVFLDASSGERAFSVLRSPSAPSCQFSTYGGGGDRKVDRTPARPVASVAHGGGQTPPLASDVGTDGQRVERGLDCAEALGAKGALVLVGRDEHTEVQLGERCPIASSETPAGALVGDQRVEVAERGLN